MPSRPTNMKPVDDLIGDGEDKLYTIQETAISFKQVSWMTNLRKV